MLCITRFLHTWDPFCLQQHVAPKDILSNCLNPTFCSLPFYPVEDAHALFFHHRCHGQAASAFCHLWADSHCVLSADRLARRMRPLCQPGKPQRHVFALKIGFGFKQAVVGGTDSALNIKPSAQCCNPPKLAVVYLCEWLGNFACTDMLTNAANHRRQTCPSLKIGFDVSCKELTNSCTYAVCI